MRKRTVFKRLSASVLTTPEKHKVYESMYGIADADTGHSGKHNSYWSAIVIEQLNNHKMI